MDAPRRKHHRWPGFDYRLPGPYHVVICTEGRRKLLAEIATNSYSLHPAGLMVEQVWRSGPDRFPTLNQDAFVVMPNHLHLVFWFEPVDLEASPTIGDVMKWFKSETTIRYGRGVRAEGWPEYVRHLWHRNYYDHVIRTDRELDAVREYIENNPRVWTDDSLYQP
ncbi:MAG: transposase [Thermomicrobiales bacterium]